MAWHRSTLRALFVALPLCFIGCDDPTPERDAGLDASLDAGGDTGVAISPDAGSDAGAASDAGAPERVLFVGNSYTFYNDLPLVVAELAAATDGVAFEVESITAGGARLATHWDTSGARARIEAGGLDAVVLQAQSVEPFADPMSFHFYARMFSGALATAGARGVWFSTWARAPGHEIYTGSFTPEQMTESLEFRYRSAAMENADRVARVGAAWLIAASELPEVTLHISDGSHPTAEGSLLTACVLLQAIGGVTPRLPDPPPLGIDPATASALCAIAPRVVCPEGQAFCGGDCVDTDTSPDHCGGCDAPCGTEEPCRAGMCGCDPGLLACNRACYDPNASLIHCGGCDNPCIDGAICDTGTCACPTANALPATFTDLSALDPGCASDLDRGSPACAAAAHAFCAALPCFDSGYGPPAGHSPRPDGVGCVAGDVRVTTFTDLATFEPGCDGTAARDGVPCASAAHRYCLSLGAAGGFGPVTSSGDDATVTCVPNATVVSTTRTELRGFTSRCDDGDPVICGSAAWNLCVARGFAWGYGPVEASGDERQVLCL